MLMFCVDPLCSIKTELSVDVREYFSGFDMCARHDIFPDPFYYYLKRNHSGLYLHFSSAIRCTLHVYRTREQPCRLHMPTIEIQYISSMVPTRLGPRAARLSLLWYKNLLSSAYERRLMSVCFPILQYRAYLTSVCGHTHPLFYDWYLFIFTKDIIII